MFCLDKLLLAAFHVESVALGLHRKGIKSVVLERSDSLQYPGAAIAIYANGWRALDQMGVGTKLRSKAIPLQMLRGTCYSQAFA
ncbi:hypothetical protein MRB53_000399 [Persea americana]|uniref:Uncharacterized protein n=1 Tax=Persea americana TaxID=3435 RepID=A0ACC2MPM0_PERAE|nr:hypothetical protein MRB53_000399 [Persea americana]